MFPSKAIAFNLPAVKVIAKRFKTSVNKLY